MLWEPGCGTVWQDWKLQGRHGHRARTGAHHETHMAMRPIGPWHLSRIQRARNLGECSFLLYKERHNKAGITLKVETSRRNKTNNKHTNQPTNQPTQLISFGAGVTSVFVFWDTFFLSARLRILYIRRNFIYGTFSWMLYILIAVNSLLHYFYQSLYFLFIHIVSSLY